MQCLVRSILATAIPLLGEPGSSFGCCVKCPFWALTENEVLVNMSLEMSQCDLSIRKLPRMGVVGDLGAIHNGYMYCIAHHGEWCGHV